MVVLTSDCLSIWERSPLQSQMQHMICSRLPLLLPSFPDDHFYPCPTLWIQPAYFNSFLGHPRSRRAVTYLVIEGPGLALLLCSLKPSSAERNVLAAKTKIKNVPRVWGVKAAYHNPFIMFYDIPPISVPLFFCLPLWPPRFLFYVEYASFERWCCFTNQSKQKEKWRWERNRIKAARLSRFVFIQ